MQISLDEKSVEALVKAGLSDVLVCTSDLELMLDLGKQTLEALFAEGFPKPVTLGKNSTRWRMSDILAWLDSKPRLSVDVSIARLVTLRAQRRTAKPVRATNAARSANAAEVA